MSRRDVLRVVQLSDMHLRARPGDTLRGVDTGVTLRAVLQAMSRDQHPDLLLLTGDLAEDAVPVAYARLRDLVGATGVPAWCLPGNHDDRELVQAELNRDGLATPRSKRMGGWLFVLLDSSVPGSIGGELGTSELAALDDVLSSHADEPTVVALHHPPVALGSRWIDALGLADAGAFINIIGAHPQVRAVIWGHAHQVWTGHWGDTQLLGCPSTCMQFEPGADEFALDDRPPGWRTLDLHPDGTLTTEVHWL